MCGSLLSEFKKPNNRVDPGILIFPDARRVRSQKKLDGQDSACYQDRSFWKDGDRNMGESSVHSSTRIPSRTSMKDGVRSESDSCPSQKEIEAAVRVLDCAKPVLSAINSTYVGFAVVKHNSEHLLESAREILAMQANGASSSSNTVTAQPFSSTNSTLPELIKPAVAFDIPNGKEKTVCTSVRLPWRLRKRGKVAPELTLEEVKERMRGAEERKLTELERIRECARSRAGMSRPHPTEMIAQATKEKIAAKQAAAAKKREEEMENRKQAGTRAWQKISRIAKPGLLPRRSLSPQLNRRWRKPRNES